MGMVPQASLTADPPSCSKRLHLISQMPSVVVVVGSLVLNSRQAALSKVGRANGPHLPELGKKTSRLVVVLSTVTVASPGQCVSILPSQL